MEAGQLVSDDIILGVIREELDKPEAAQGVIFDGVVRTIPQAEGMERLLAERRPPDGRRCSSFDVHRRGDPRSPVRRRAIERRADDDPAAVAGGSRPTASRPRRCWPGTRRGAIVRRVPAVGTVDDDRDRVRRALGRYDDHPQVAARDRGHGHGGRIVAATLAMVRDMVRPGMSTEDLDPDAEEFIRSHPGAKPSFKGLYGFPKTLCISINEEIVHGIPSKKRVLREGNIVSVDVGVHLEGLHADSATTVAGGRDLPGGPAAAGGDAASAGGRACAGRRSATTSGDIGHAVQQVAEGAGYGVVRELVGHGIGARFHEEPQVPNYGPPKRRGPGCWRG